MDLRELPTSTAFRRHPWEEARARFFGDLVVGQLGSSRPVRILDVGAGDGYLAGQLLPRLARGSDVTCFDRNYAQPSLAAAPTPGVAFTATRPVGRFDAVLMLDVVEHVLDDVTFVRDLVGAVMADDAIAVVSVPAWMGLFTRHDVRLGHYRRYRPAELEALVRRCGLRSVGGGPLFSSLLLPRALTKLGELAHGVRSAPALTVPTGPADTGLGTWNGGPMLTRGLRAALELDGWLGRRLAEAGIRLPGLSAWILARKAPTVRGGA